MNTLGAVFSIVVGLGLALLHKRIAGFCVMMWRRHCRMNPPSEAVYQIFFFIVGMLFLICGVLLLLGILK